MKDGALKGLLGDDERIARRELLGVLQGLTDFLHNNDHNEAWDNGFKLANEVIDKIRETL